MFDIPRIFANDDGESQVGQEAQLYHGRSVAHLLDKRQSRNISPLDVRSRRRKNLGCFSRSPSCSKPDLEQLTVFKKELFCDSPLCVYTCTYGDSAQPEAQSDRKIFPDSQRIRDNDLSRHGVVNIRMGSFYGGVYQLIRYRRRSKQEKDEKMPEWTSDYYLQTAILEVHGIEKSESTTNPPRGVGGHSSTPAQVLCCTGQTILQRVVWSVPTSDSHQATQHRKDHFRLAPFVGCADDKSWQHPARDSGILLQTSLCLEYGAERSLED